MLRLLLLILAACLPAAAQATWAKEVSRIVDAKCAQCHRAGDIAPFPLTSFQNAVDYSADIRRVVDEGIMPPWKPIEGHGKFSGNFGLTDEEKFMLRQWIEAGMPFGNEADLPAAQEPKGEWYLGEPDVTLQLPEPYEPEVGKDVYRCFVLPTGMDADKFISAVDILPGNRKIVHHVIVYLDPTGQAEKLDEKDPGPGYNCYGGPGFDIDVANVLQFLRSNYTLGGWAPGARPAHLEDGTAMHLGKQAKMVLQVHYYTGGLSSGADQTKIGLYYPKKPVERRLLYLPLVQTRMAIPPNEADFPITANFTVPLFFDFRMVSIFPHMHLLGRRIQVEATRDGETSSMLLINNWDFNWQGSYYYEKPDVMKAGTRLRLTCRYDNTANNPRNPSNPLKTVTWGEGTEDEMCLAFMGVTLNNERLLLGPILGPTQ
jgi:hypothetical protein